MNQFLKKPEKIVLTAVVVFVLLALALALFLVWQTRSKPQPAPILPKEFKVEAGKSSAPIKFAGEGTLFLRPSESFSLKIVPVSKLSALVYRLEILFDPEILSAEEITAGEFFQSPQILRKEIDNEIGRLYLSVGITPGEMQAAGEPKSGDLLATLFLKTKPIITQKENPETTISFGKKTIFIGREAEWENSDDSLGVVTIVIKK